MRAEHAIKESKGGRNFFKCLIKGSLIALSISLIAICIFAFVLRFCDLSEEVIKPVNQIIKIVSVLVGAYIGMKGCKEMGLITGFFIGLLYTLLAFVVFSLLNGAFNFNSSLINDLIFGGIAGGISGILAVNFRKK